MPWRLAISIYNEYYCALMLCYMQFEYLKEKKDEQIKSFFAELEKSDIPDWAKMHFVDFILNHPHNFRDVYFANREIMTTQQSEEKRDIWIKEQKEGSERIGVVLSKTYERIERKKEGITFDDEKKYEGIEHILRRYGTGFTCHLSLTKNQVFINLYKNYVTEGRNFKEEKEALEQELIKKLELWRKVESIHNQNNNINNIVEILNSCPDLEAIYEEYSKLLDDLKINNDIYNCVKNKFLNQRDLSFTENNYMLTFFIEYGEICANTNDKTKIQSAIDEIKVLASTNPTNAYQILIGLYDKVLIEFDTYLELYNLFSNNYEIQGNLLTNYLEIKNELAVDYQMIRLFDASNDECIKQNWKKGVNSEFFSKSLYSYLLNRGISKDNLDNMEQKHNYYLNKIEKEKIEQQKQEKRIKVKSKILSLFKNN